MLHNRDLEGGLKNLKNKKRKHIWFVSLWSQEYSIKKLHQAFPVTAACVGGLPQHVASAPSVAVFLSHLKIYLFLISYPTSYFVQCSHAVTFVAFHDVITRVPYLPRLSFTEPENWFCSFPLKYLPVSGGGSRETIRFNSWELANCRQ